MQVDSLLAALPQKPKEAEVSAEAPSLVNSEASKTVASQRQSGPECQHYILGFPDGSDGKEFACNAGELGLIPGLGRSSEEEDG